MLVNQRYTNVIYKLLQTARGQMLLISTKRDLHDLCVRLSIYLFQHCLMFDDAELRPVHQQSHLHLNKPKTLLHIAKEKKKKKFIKKPSVIMLFNFGCNQPTKEIKIMLTQRNGQTYIQMRYILTFVCYGARDNTPTERNRNEKLCSCAFQSQNVQIL